MRFQRALIGAIVAVAAAAFAAALLPLRSARAAQDTGKKHLLVVTVTKGFRHADSIAVAEPTIQMLGDQNGKWDTDFVRSDEEMKTKMTAEALKKYDAVVFANTTGVLPLPDPQGFLDYIKAGHGFAATHSGSDTFHQWPGSSASVSEYIEMLGGEFLTHHSQCAVYAKMEDPKHPALAPLEKMPAPANPVSLEAKDVRQASALDGATWKVFDEIYLFKNNDRAKIHVLLSMDKHPDDGSPEANKPGDYLLSWCKSYGKGRVFYTELGHRTEVWKDPLYQKHLEGGLLFALGLAKGSTKLSTPLSAK
jgi:type 1 glutamine amidotransferase